MNPNGEDRFSFIAEWYDPQAALTRKYTVLFYPVDTSVEMFDVKNGRKFLTRSKIDSVRLKDLYIGSSININSRQLTFTDYADNFTRKQLEVKTERTLAMIKPDAISKMGEILERICERGFLITKMKMCQLTRNEAKEFYGEHQSKPFFNSLITLITSGQVIAMELMGESAIGKWRQFLGPTDAAIARSEAPTSLRAQFGKGGTENACHGSDSPASAARELEYFFPTSTGSRPNTARFKDSTCCVIKPHSVINGFAGKIIQKISESFQISAMMMFHMEQANAEEFHEVYKGVVQEYPDMVKELTSGSCIAMEITPKGNGPVYSDEPFNCAKAFREFCGPADPEIARNLRPNTLRSMFGKNKVQNGVHCTDLPEDGLLEVEYFFKILAQ